MIISDNAKHHNETWWNLERPHADGKGSSHVVGYRDHDKALADAKPRGRRKAARVVRLDQDHITSMAGDITIQTTITRRTVEVELP